MTAAKRLEGSLRALSVDLYRELAGGGDGSFSLSPASIAIGLSMALAGARGATAGELTRVMHLEGVAGQEAAFGRLAWILRGGEPAVIAAANRLWVTRHAALRADFLALIAEHHGAGVEAIDSDDPAAAANAINSWVASNTRDRIRDLIPPSAFRPDTRLLITNALFLEAIWECPFDPEASAVGSFHRLGGSAIDARFMRMTETLGLAAAGGAHAVELDYAGGELSMVLVLPDDPAGFRRFEAELDGERLARLLAALVPAPVSLVMPVWTSESAVSLVDALRALGAAAMFTDEADFGGITDVQPGLMVSDVLHRTFVQVDEKGTEAAAASAIVALALGPPPRPAVPYSFTADRPFLYLIRHRLSGAILFIGRVADPTA